MTHLQALASAKREKEFFEHRIGLWLLGPYFLSLIIDHLGGQSFPFSLDLSSCIHPKMSPNLQSIVVPATVRMGCKLESLALEIQHLIFNYLSQEMLYNLTITSPSFSEVATTILYHSPAFPSSFRFAQFVTTISHSRQHAEMVRIFRVSGETEDRSRASKLASWIEWKYRTVPYYAAEPVPKHCSKFNTRPYEDTHPKANKWIGERAGNYPAGGIIHVLAACSKIRSRASKFVLLNNELI